MSPTLALRLHEFAKGDADPNVNVTCLFLVNGEPKGVERFVAPEKDLPEKWAEDDLLAWLNAHERVQALGVTATRTPTPKEGALE